VTMRESMLTLELEDAVFVDSSDSAIVAQVVRQIQKLEVWSEWHSLPGDVGMNEQTTTYTDLIAEITNLLEVARQQASQAVNSVLVMTYWRIGQRIVEQEQHGAERAGYGEKLIERLAVDLTATFGRGFSQVNLQTMRLFYLAFPSVSIPQTVSGEFAFPLSWSHYVLLLRRAKSPEARDFYHSEALRGGWTVRQLQRQLDSQFYERLALSKNKAALLAKQPDPDPNPISIKDPFVLEFLGLKDEYSESNLEEALIAQLENFLLELGSDFAFMGRQKRLRIGEEWYRIDLLFFHRKLRCLVVIDLKLGKFNHADAGQMHVYLNYAKQHWTNPDENPPVGLILCADKDQALAQYALDGLPNKILAAEYRLQLPDEAVLVRELERTRQALMDRNELEGHDA
jgi:predicted nuclease of restriction endonuclease-like (RecB) superfamily